MNLVVKPLKDNNEWTEFVDSYSGASFFHSLKWKEVIEANFGLKSLYLVAKNEVGDVVGVCPGFIAGSRMVKFYNSLPYSDYGGPLSGSVRVNYGFSEYLQRFSVKEGLAYAKMCLLDNGAAFAFKSPLSHVERSKGVMEIDLNHVSSVDIWNKVFSSNSRRHIRRLDRSSYRAYELTSKRELEEFYKAYCTNMGYVGSIPYNFSFIQSIWEHLYSSNVRIWLMGEKRVFGGLFVLKDAKGSIVWLVGIDRESPHTFSVYLYLVWKEILASEKEKLGKVSLGSTPSNPDDLHHKIKIELGATFRQQELVWFPLSARGKLLLLVRGKTVNRWKSLRNFLPTVVRAPLENRLLRL